jgi:fructosamine-3-kinase
MKLYGTEEQRIELTRAQATALLENWLGKGVTCESTEPMEGGFCSEVYRLRFDWPPHRAVVKLRPDSDGAFGRERLFLDYLRRNTRFPCPEVYAQDDSRTVIPFAFLLLECMPGMNLDAARLAPGERETVERELAEAVLELHSHTRDTFGGVDEEPGIRDWSDVFLPDLAENRRDMEGLLPASLLSDLDRILELAREAFRDQGVPTLVHRDLWGGNIMVEERDGAWHLSGLLDPTALRFGEAEEDLAYLQTFGTVGSAFFDVYTKERPLRPGYEYRRLFYSLNTYLLHVWLGFGPPFPERVAATAREILAFGARGAGMVLGGLRALRTSSPGSGPARNRLW